MAKAATSAKAPANKAAAKPASKSAAPEKAPAKKRTAGALAKPLKPSNDLAAIVGSSPLPRTEVVSKIWEYIRKNNLQNPTNKREILADAKLEAVFGQKKASMFEMNKLISKHLT